MAINIKLFIYAGIFHLSHIESRRLLSISMVRSSKLDIASDSILTVYMLLCHVLSFLKHV